MSVLEKITVLDVDDKKLYGFLLKKDDEEVQSLYFLPKELNKGFIADCIGFANCEDGTYKDAGYYFNAKRDFILTLSKSVKESLSSVELEVLENDENVIKYKKLKGIS